jgi:hypothetical protein
VSDVLSPAAPALAGIFTLLVAWTSVRWLNGRRTRRFREYKGRSQQTVSASFKLPPIIHSSALHQLNSLSTLPANAHQRSIEAQNKYRASAIRSGTCLFLAFLSVSLSATSFKELSCIELPLAWLEIISIGLAIFYFLLARTAHEGWIKLRAGAELQRQYIYMKIVFPDLNASANASDITSQVAVNLASIVEQVVNDRPGADLTSRIETFWQTRRSAIKIATLCEQDASHDRLLLYIRRRCLRQLGWFMDSRARLEREANDRKTVLKWLYVAAVTLVILKFLSTLFALQHQDVVPSGTLAIVTDGLLFLLLMITGISGSMTAYYLNQNSRSLIHRYKSQERRIERWSQSFTARAFVDGETVDPNGKISKNDARDRVLEFEDMMIEELIDWIHISFNDAIELAP